MPAARRARLTAAANLGRASNIHHEWTWLDEKSTDETALFLIQSAKWGGFSISAIWSISVLALYLTILDF
jgi:hypothetical protein